MQNPDHKPGDQVASTSDDRTANNGVRHSYRVLTDFEKAQMQRIKDLGAELLNALHDVGGTKPEGGRMGSRELSIAQTKTEEAVMWAVKHITR